MLTAEYDREMDIAVNRREAMKEGMEKEKLIIAKNLLEKGSTPESLSDIGLVDKV